MNEYIDELLQEYETWIEDYELLEPIDQEEYWEQDPGISLEL